MDFKLEHLLLVIAGDAYISETAGRLVSEGNERLNLSVLERGGYIRCTVAPKPHAQLFVVAREIARDDYRITRAGAEVLRLKGLLQRFEEV